MIPPRTQADQEAGWANLYGAIAHVLHPKTGQYKYGRGQAVGPIEDWLMGMSENDLAATRQSLGRLSAEGKRLFRAMEEVFSEAPATVFDFVMSEDDRERTEAGAARRLAGTCKSTAAAGKSVDEKDPAAPLPKAIRWSDQFAAINDSLPELRERLYGYDHKKICTPFCRMLRAILDLAECGVDLDYRADADAVAIADLASVEATNRHAALQCGQDPAKTAEGTLFAWLTLDRILADRCRYKPTKHQTLVAGRREILQQYRERVAGESDRERKLSLLGECDLELLSLAAA